MFFRELFTSKICVEKRKGFAQGFLLNLSGTLMGWMGGSKVDILQSCQSICRKF